MRNILSPILKSRKCDAPSLIISLVVIIFAIILISLFFSKFFLALVGEMKAMPQFQNSTAQESFTAVEEKTIPFLDYLIWFSFVSIIIGLIISSFYIDVHPAFFIAFIIILIFVTVLAGVFSNVIQTVGQDSQMASTYSQFRITPIIVNNFPAMVFVVGLMVAIVLYGKSRGGNVPV